jgi:hypothetical protein
MTSQDEPTRYEVSFPATPAQVGLARLFIAAVLRGADLGEHAGPIVDDAKLAVSELVTALVEGGSVERVTVRAWIGASPGFTVGPWVDPSQESDFGPYAIVEALFPGAHVLDDHVLVPVAAEPHD